MSRGSDLLDDTIRYGAFYTVLYCTVAMVRPPACLPTCLTIEKEHLPTSLAFPAPGSGSWSCGFSVGFPSLLFVLPPFRDYREGTANGQRHDTTRHDTDTYTLACTDSFRVRSQQVS